ncbi:MAG: hypothetical protein HKN68_16275 [Saprospiraceae bacterium]|nr:hypothetical protein [Saprospiraceae bacterium]
MSELDHRSLNAMNSFKKLSLCILLLGIVQSTLFSQLVNCDSAIVPDDLFNDKVSINLSDMCSACGPYGGNNGTIGNPPNGATGCAIIRFRQDALINCVGVTVDPQATEKTDYYLNSSVSEMDCFMPDGTTSSQGDVFQFDVNTLTFTDGFFDLLVCSQSTGNRSYEVIIGCCPRAGMGRDTSICENDSGVIDLYSLLSDADPGGSWSRMSGMGGSFDAMNGTYQSAVGATTSTFEYTADNGGNQGCNFTSIVTINITPAPNAGIDGSVDLCSNGNGVNLIDYLGGPPPMGGTWIGPSLLSNSDQGTFDPSSNDAGLYQYIVLGSGGCDNDTADVQVQIIQFPSAGTNGSLSFCDNETMSRALISGLGGMPDSGGSWAPATMVEGFFDPMVDIPGTYTYTVTGDTPCGNSSATVMVSVSDVPDPGLDNEITICSNAEPFNLIDQLGGNPDGGGEWTPALNSGSNVFDPNLDGAGQYTYSFSIQGCNTETATVTVNINQALTGGNNASLTVCHIHDPVSLYSLIGDPGTSGTWSGPEELEDNHIGTFDPGVQAGGTYYYTIPGEAPCADLILEVEVNVYEAPFIGTNTSIEVCDSDSPMDLTTFLGDNVSPDGYWIPTLNSNDNMYAPLDDGEGMFTYNVDGTDECPPQSVSIMITTYKPFQAGQSAIVTVFENDPPFDLFDKLGMNPNPLGTWNPAPLSGNGLFDPSVDESGIFTFNTPANVACEADFANVQVIVLSSHGIPTMGTWGIIILSLMLVIFSISALKERSKIIIIS